MTLRSALMILVAGSLFSCRGQVSERPPVQPQQNMYFQERFNAQQENTFFDDGRSMRTPVEGTVARGQLREDTRLYEGLDDEGEFVTENPLPLSSDFLYRGQNRYDVYCSMCHGGTGDGRGIIIVNLYGLPPAPTFHQESLRDAPDGRIYSAIHNGFGTMASYRTQIPVEDRWAIVAYVRALQRSQNLTEDEVAAMGANIASIQSEYQQEQERQQALEEAQAESATAAPAGSASADAGRNVFVQNGCQACHTVDGSPGIGPTLQNLYGNDVTLSDGSTVTADEEYVRESIVEPAARVTSGFDAIMPAYSYLAENDIESLIEYIKSLSDN